MLRFLSEASRRDLAAAALLVLGLTAMVGDATGSRVLKGIGLATAASPLPKVFSDVDGYEPFAANFTLLVTTADGFERRIPITPALYAQVEGPYNRRNVYGAALSYAPRLPDELWRPPFCYGMAEGGALRAEIGVPDDAVRIRVEISTRTRGREEQWVLEPSCR